MSYFWRIAEERILDAQRAGAFDDLPGKGKPLNLEDMSWVPEDLRIGYHILKNAHVLPPEAELMKDIYTLEDLLKHVEDEGEPRALAKSIQAKVIRLDLLKRRSLSVASVRSSRSKISGQVRRATLKYRIEAISIFCLVYQDQLEGNACGSSWRRITTGRVLGRAQGLRARPHPASGDQFHVFRNSENVEVRAAGPWLNPH